ncbi:hypothetical protein [Baekduia alba]|uniref:hypothetical protein n=1 Tax=Baekduia alba TaxID=2997333 RepID=UPI00234029E2|nr:hypothetical protein [Baekduia alba]
MAAAALTSATAGPAAAAGTPIIDGTLGTGGTWALSIRHQDIGAVKGVCIEIDTAPTNGTAGGTAGGCAAGSLRVDHGLFPLTATSHEGDAVTSAVAAGIVDARAHDVRLTFADGKHLKILTKPGPRAWRHVLKMDVRYFGADLLTTSSADIRYFSAYDRHGHRITRIEGKA